MEQVILTPKKKKKIIDQVKQGFGRAHQHKKRKQKADKVKEMGEQWKKHFNSFFILNCHDPNEKMNGMKMMLNSLS